MKKLITLLATATLALSSVAFADDAQSNDVKTIPGGQANTVVADASSDASSQGTAQDADKKAMKKHHKKHGKKHHHHAKKDMNKDTMNKDAAPQTPGEQPMPPAQ